MAGITLESFDRAFGAMDGVLTVDSPVMYDVWREFALRGPQARVRLLLRVSESTNSLDVANRLRAESNTVTRLRATQEPRLNQTIEQTRLNTEPLVGVLGEWLLVQADLVHMLTIVLPLTRWATTLDVVAALSESAMGDLLAPLDELLDRTDSRAQESQSTPRDDARPEVVFTQRDQETASWFLRLVVRMWGFDPDFDSERILAVDHLREILNVLANRPARQVSEAAIDGISLDRRATIAAIPSAQIVKADATRRLFNVSASNQIWAVLDTGINARHSAFAGDADTVTRIVETFDLTSISDDDLAAFDPESAPLDRLVEIVQSCAIPAWNGQPNSPYREPIPTHGTHVAGILAGHIPGVYEGVCPDLRLWDFRVLNNRSEGDESRILVALRFIRHFNDRERAIRIAGVNLSISLAYDPKNHACGWTPVCEEVRRLARSGVVVVAAAGNFGYQPRGAAGPSSSGMTPTSKGTGFETVSITDPGNTEEAITVGATHGVHPYRYGTSFFSGKGPTADGRMKPDLLAPGEHILGPAGRQGFVSLDGTSQAAPHVAGAAALLMARYPELIGQPERVKQILCDTATDLGRDRNFQGHGLVDVLRASQSV